MPNQRHKTKIRSLLGLLFLSSLTLSLWLSHLPSTPVATAQSPPPSQFVQQGVEHYQNNEFQAAIESWQSALQLYQDTNNRPNTAIVRENLARAYQEMGQIENAIAYWQHVINDYRQLGNPQKVGRMQTELAQAYNRTGQPRKAIALLCGISPSDTEHKCTQEKGSALHIAQDNHDLEGKVAAFGTLGEAYRQRGNYEQAIRYLEESQTIAQTLNTSLYYSSGLNNLGTAHFSRAQLNESRANSAQLRNANDKAQEFIKKATTDYQQAQTYFNESLKLAHTQNDQPAQMRALLNLIRLYYLPKEATLTDNPKIADNVFNEALELLKTLPNSRTKVYAAIDLATLKPPTTTSNSPSLQAQCSPRKLNESQAEKLLLEAAAIAHTLQEPRSQSFALGELGHLYECRQNYQEALNFTNKAKWLADQNMQAKDSLYLWEWQTARIYRQQDNQSEAITAYEQAIATLNDIRGDLVVAERDIQFDFRDAINPLHREFAQLRLERASLPTIQPDELKQELDSALETIDSLKLAELQNYFGNDCILTVFDEEKINELVGKDTAVFSSIILEDRTAILVSLPNGEERQPPKLEWINVNRETISQEIIKFREGLLDRSSSVFYDKTQAQKLYNWIVKPFAKDLENAQIKTLVFIQDGILRSIPMAALHDGEKFLIENYALATTPSLTLTDPQALNRQALQTLAFGLTEATEVNGERFPALNNVEKEINQVITQFPGSKTFLNSDFQRESLQQELSNRVYPIIHIATHGKFGTVPEDTFLVTGNNEVITLTELESDIQRFSRGSDSVELLALTACETAVGDDRSTLGLAGIAVRAGVKGTLASLWPISDASTQIFVNNFYANLKNPGVSKAQALRAAQLELIKAENNEEINDDYIHPYFWAPFIIIGNWL